MYRYIPSLCMAQIFQRRMSRYYSGIVTSLNDKEVEKDVDKLMKEYKGYSVVSIQPLDEVEL